MHANLSKWNYIRFDAQSGWIGQSNERIGENVPGNSLGSDIPFIESGSRTLGLCSTD